MAPPKQQFVVGVAHCPDFILDNDEEEHNNTNDDEFTEQFMQRFKWDKDRQERWANQCAIVANAIETGGERCYDNCLVCALERSGKNTVVETRDWNVELATTHSARILHPTDIVLLTNRGGSALLRRLEWQFMISSRYCSVHWPILHVGQLAVRSRIVHNSNTKSVCSSGVYRHPHNEAVACMVRNEL